jgi:hypothetical protein
LVALLLKYNGITKNYSRQGVLQLMSLEQEKSGSVDGSPSIRSQREGENIKRKPKFGIPTILMTMTFSAVGSQHQASCRSRVQDHDNDSDEVDSSIGSQPDASLIRRLRDLELRHYDPDIPCEAYDAGLGYTITIV